MAGADSSHDLTGLIRLWRAGDRDAERRLFEIVVPHLRQMAGRYMSRERRDHTLQPTELVNEIYFKLSAAREIDWQDRGHFFAIAARAMRHCLIDHARGRPGVHFVPLEAIAHDGGRPLDPETLLELDLLLDRLKEKDPEQCAIVEMKYFLGLTDEEVSEMLGVRVRTLQRRWQDARKWLFQRLSGEVDDARR